MTTEAAVPAAYRVIPLGHFALEGELPTGVALSINEDLVAVGQLNTYFEGQWIGGRASRWPEFDNPLNQGDLLNLTSSYTISLANDINNQEISVGWSNGQLPGISGSPREAVWWGPTDTLPNRLPLGQIRPESSQSTAYAINDSGIAVGEVRYILDGSWDALAWPSMTSEPIVLPNTTYGALDVLAHRAVDVNDSGIIVGYGDRSPRGTGEPLYLPVVWDSNDNYSPLVLPLDPRISESRKGAVLTGVNASGQIIGQGTVWDTSQGREVGSAVRWNSVSEPPEELLHAPLSGIEISSNITQDINDNGLVVGFTWDGGSNSQAIIWDEDANYHYVDDLLLDAHDTSVIRAYGINNSGWIAAIADMPGGARAVLLMPVPEPSCIYIALVGSLSIFFARRNILSHVAGFVPRASE